MKRTGMVLQTILEGFGLGALLLLVCAVGICKGAVGMIDDGWVRVSLDADHKFFYVTVADSGMGIPEDSLSRIFERFYRGDKSHSREIGGTGLGLAITRSTIGMHHGVIKVFSKEGEGTTFSVRVPLSYIP